MTTAVPMDTTDKRLQALAYVLGAAHVVFAVPKLLALPVMVEQFHGWGLPAWMMTFVGVAQLLGGVGMFIRNIRLPSSLAMALVMVGATVTVLASGHEMANVVITVPVALGCLAVALHRLLQFGREKVAEAAAAA